MYRDLLAEQRNTIVGIDLGTTNSLIAVATDCSVRILSAPDGARALPSVAGVDASGRVIVGQVARAARVRNPLSTVSSIKRFMGMSAAEAQTHAAEVSYRISDANARVASAELGGQTLSAPEISALYLKELKRWAETDLGRPIERAVITVPAYFNDAQRQATRDAGRIAGLEVLRIVNEPTAAALAYGLEKNQQGVVAVYDFGGGTFDVSILRLTDGVFEVLATGGDTRLGGDDIDWIIGYELYGRAGLPGDFSVADPAIRQAFVSAAENAKIQLSTLTKVEVIVELPDGREWSGELTREEMEHLAAPIVERTIAIAGEVLRGSDTDASMLDEVLLVGGSSRMPLVQRGVAELFGRVPRYDIDPEEVVALGAAVQGRILAGGLHNMLLLDVTPLSLGIESWGGAFDVLIPRNTTIPASASQMFTTNVEGQKNILLHVLQGEREMAADNRSLARFTLTDLPPMRAGEPRVEVTFSLDADGVLSVGAVEQRTGCSAKIDVKPGSGLSDEEVQAMVRASYANASEDFQKRILLDRRNEAESVLTAIERALAQTGKELRPDYRVEVETARDRLRAVLRGDDADAVKRELEHVNRVTEELATIQMNTVLAATVKGRKLDALS